MIDKEKEAIEILKDDEMYITDSFYREFRTTIADKYTKAFETVLNLIQTQQEEIEQSNKVIDKRNEEKLELVGMCLKKDTLIHTMQAEFERLEDLEDNTDMLKLELQKKDKIIDEMAKSLLVKEIGTNHCGYDKEYSCIKSKEDYRDINCRICIKEYFTKKVEEKQ